MGRIKVLNIIMDGRMAGPQIRVAQMSSILSEKFDVDTTVVFPIDRSEKFETLLEREDINFQKIKVRKLTKNIAGLFLWGMTFLPDVLRIVRVLKKESPDIIQCNGAWQWKGVIAGKIMGEKIVWHLNDTYAPFIIRKIFKLLKPLVNGFITQGSRVTDYYLGQSKKKKVFEIHAGVDMRQFTPESSQVNKELSRRSGTKIVTIGNVNGYKGFEYFVDAAFLLNQKFSDLHFFIVGGLFDTQKKYIEMLKKKISTLGLNNVHLTGYIEDMPSVLETADVFVSSSVTEASPQSVWQAMAMEKPIVTTNTGAVSDFILDGVNGFIVEIRNSVALAERIGVLIRNKKMRNAFGKNARIAAIENLDINVIAADHSKAYREIINE